MNELIENKKKSEILAEKILAMNYGDVVTHKEIASIIEETVGSHKYTSTIQKTKKILLNNHRAIESVRGQGYRLVEPDNFVDLSLSHYKRGFNEMQKGANTLKSAPVNDMTDEGRRVYRRVQDRAITLQAAMNGAKVELKTLGMRDHPMSINNVSTG